MSGASDVSRYFFTFPDSAFPSDEDEGGIVLQDDIAAWQEAAQILTELARDEFLMGVGATEMCVQISDQTHRPLFKVRMHFTVEDLRRN